MRLWLTLPFLTLPLLAADWKKDLLFRATFDGSVNAQTAAGDKTLYSAPSYKEAGKPGLEGSGAEHAKGAGRKGDALRFPVKNTKAIYFKAGPNISPAAGTISLWLKLDPDQDLAPGFCDPLQVTDKAYNDSAIWIDFTKDERPRYFRLGVFGALKSWNTENINPDKNPTFNNRLVVVKKPPFSRDRWTHIAISYTGLGAGNGSASLYVNGELQGNSTPVKEAFDWSMDKATIRLGINYTGLMDDIATFRRPLSAKEIAELAAGKW